MITVVGSTFGSGMKRMQGLASRPLMLAAFEDHVSKGSLIVLCGEPGMGKDGALEAARVVGKQFDARLHTIDLEGLAQNAASEKMIRESRSLLRRLPPACWAVVCVRGVPPLDERCVYRMKGSITRLRESGCCVVLALRPEALQLAEACVDAYYLWSDELSVKPPEHLDEAAQEEMRQLTAYVPFLANTLVIRENDGVREIRAGREYHDALCETVGLALRRTLIADERALRLAMLLLGSGTFAQLAEVMGELDLELLQDIARHAPIFGVDIAQASFSCAGLCRDEWLCATIFTLRGFCGEHPELCTRVAELLLKEGNPARAGSIFELCDGYEDAVSLALRWCCELVNVGKADVVRRALSQAIQYRCCSPQLRHAAQILLKLVDNARLDANDIDFDPLDIAIDAERDEALRLSILLSARLAWQGKGHKIVPEAAALTDGLARDLMLHLSVTHALVEGRGHAAYHLLVCGSQLTGKDTLMGQLLEADLAFAHVLMGLPCPGTPIGKRSLPLDGACMLCYLPAIASLDAVWRQGSKTCVLDRLDVLSAQSGDELVQAHFLLAGAIANARMGALSHAIVKCNRAIAITTRLSATYLAEAAQVLYWAIRINASDMPGAEEFAEAQRMGAGMQALANVLELVAAGESEVPPHLRDRALDRDVAWLASSLLTGLTQLSPLLERTMPPTWLVIIESIRAREEDDISHTAVRLMADNLPGYPEHSIYVRLLGGIDVFVNGEKLPIKMLEGRRAKSLVAYVCSSSAHSMRRADVIDALWPECDYERGAKRIYAATNVINSAVRSIDPESRFFTTRTRDHAMSLDEACVRSDVMEFEELARRVIANEGNDDEVLSLVRGAQALYQGDLYVPPGDASRVIERRRVDLRELFTDVLVAGAEAAYRRGSLRLATHLCEQALLADETREDAIACLVKSLSSCGRNNEARDRSKAFVARMGAIRRERANRE